MSITVELLYQQAQQLTLEDRQRLVQLLVAAPPPAEAIAPLGVQLRALRAQIVASGEPLLDEDALAIEVAERRGER
ncbi:MAG: hypothetical protein EI684_07685 [Candidatus Viridilinea halotolerans]|uniref:Addiction module protein n=1 Tax=Candidatus Viridilinea halotolerans TaxID=2491704 RepID=A0A426U2Z2_9CHLR|nr:MAG: hypothetical protein EI684_07685 [Candidatus Viridilinea halotolerans]